MVDSHCSYEGKGKDNEVFWRDSHAPLDDEPANAEDNCLVQYVEWEDCLISIVDHPVAEIQVPYTQAQDENDPAPVGEAYYDLKEHEH